MSPKSFAFLAVALAGLLLSTSLGGSQTVRRASAPQPIAETRLLMEGLTHANFRGLERILKKKPTERKQWLFARGQALLIAETANLLLIRPPSTGREVWTERALDMQTAARNLVTEIADCDYNACRNALFRLANACNRCHQSFRVSTKITPFTKDQQ